HYEKLLESAGEPSESNYFRYSGMHIPENVTWGPHSPKSAEVLGKEDPQKVLEFLRTWKPEKGINAPKPEGLARALQEAVKSNAESFSSRATTFTGIETTYIRPLIGGLRHAQK